MTIPNNYYPVSFSDFKRIKDVGHYVVMYAVLDDRIHFEMAVENSVYVSQRFFEDIEAEIKMKAENFIGDVIIHFLKMTLNDVTFYKYYPTEDQVEEMLKIKLYKHLVVTETQTGIYNSSETEMRETDNLLKAYNGNELIMQAEKVQ